MLASEWLDQLGITCVRALGIAASTLTCSGFVWGFYKANVMEASPGASYDAVIAGSIRGLLRTGGNRIAAKSPSQETPLQHLRGHRPCSGEQLNCALQPGVSPGKRH